MIIIPNIENPFKSKLMAESRKMRTTRLASRNGTSFNRETDSGTLTQITNILTAEKLRPITDQLKLLTGETVENPLD